MGGRGAKQPSAITEAQGRYREVDRDGAYWWANDRERMQRNAGIIKAREASYAEIPGINVTINGETRTYYFDSNDGTNYVSDIIGGAPKETPNNMTATEFVERIQSNGGQVKIITAAQRSKLEQEAYERHKNDNSDPTLGYGIPGFFRDNARSRRLSRISSRRR